MCTRCTCSREYARGWRESSTVRRRNPFSFIEYGVVDLDQQPFERNFSRRMYFLRLRPFSIVFPSSTRNSFLGRRPAALQFRLTQEIDRFFFFFLSSFRMDLPTHPREFLSEAKICARAIDGENDSRIHDGRMPFPRFVSKNFNFKRSDDESVNQKIRKNIFIRSSLKEFSLFKLCRMIANSSIV